MIILAQPPKSLFQDRPWPQDPIVFPRLSLPALGGLDYNDPAESLLRLLLVLCLLISLAVCFHRRAPHPAMVAGGAATPPLVVPQTLPRVSGV